MAENPATALERYQGVKGNVTWLTSSSAGVPCSTRTNPRST